MPEPTSPSAVIETQPAAPVTEPQTPTTKPADADQRAAIQAKYEEKYGVTPPAPAAQPVVAPAPVTPTPNQDVADMRAQIAELKAAIAAQAKPAEPVAPAVPATEADWLALLASGNKTEGEKAMAQRVKELIGAELNSQAVAQATERINAERQINDFVTEVRTVNADLLPMERFITLGAQQRLQAAANAGRINSPSDYVTVYKEAVLAEIEATRTLSQSIRGAGKLEGTTRTAEVLASSMLQPNQVTQAREQAQAPAGEAIESTSDYMQRRQALKAQQQGM